MKKLSDYVIDLTGAVQFLNCNVWEPGVFVLTKSRIQSCQLFFIPSSRIIDLVELVACLKMMRSLSVLFGFTSFLSDGSY